MFKYILAAGAIIIVCKLLRFFTHGGSLTLPAINATHLYYQIKNVYGKLPEDVAMYMALLLNSRPARNQFSESDLANRVKDGLAHGGSWEEICAQYTWDWAERVGHTPLSRIPRSLLIEKDSQIRKEIRKARTDIENGGVQFERQLRSLSQAEVIMILASFEGI